MGKFPIAGLVLRPYFQNELVTIYHGDSSEILPDLPQVDLVIADPPYGMQFKSGHRKGSSAHSLIIGDDVLPIDMINVCIQKAKRACYIFCRWDNLYALPKPRSVLAWVKNNWSMGDLKHEHGRQWEACCFYPKEEHAFIKRIPDVIHADRTGNNLHPTQKPIVLLKTIIAANVGAVILDPFMGSGSTLMAAQSLQRIAIGVDIEEKNCEIAAKTLQGIPVPIQGNNEKGLFDV